MYFSVFKFSTEYSWFFDEGALVHESINKLSFEIFLFHFVCEMAITMKFIIWKLALISPFLILEFSLASEFPFLIELSCEDTACF